MTEIIFTKTRFEYLTYTEYDEMIRLSGFETCFVDEIDFEEEVIYIFSPINGEFRPTIDRERHKEKNCKIIHWCLERPEMQITKFLDGLHDTEKAYLIDDTWFSDRRLAEETQRRFVPVGGHPDYGQPTEKKVYDLIHLSYVWGRRGTIWHQLKGFKVAPNGWGMKRHNRLRHSKYLVNIHQRGDYYLEPLRFILAALYEIPIISEDCADPFPYVAGEDFISASYEDIAENIIRAASGPYEAHAVMAHNLRKKMTTEFVFKDLVEKAVSDFEGGE